MTPTFAGRWQSRILLFLFIGLPVTFLFAWVQAGGDLTNLSDVPFLFLCTLFVIGMVLDPVYYWIQTYRWERDWPFAYQWVVMWLEFWIVVVLILVEALPFLPSSRVFPSTSTFLVFSWEDAFLQVLLHFTLVFIPSFLALLGGFQIFMIRWRFKGGEWGRL